MRFANLEQQLGVQLFDRDRTRKPTLTDVGPSVLSEARTVSMGVDSLRAKIRGRLSGFDLPLSGAVGFYAMQTIHRTDTAPGPAAAWMMRRFSQQANVD
jgi:DNA-binding transcriptional LysR family regulator